MSDHSCPRTEKPDGVYQVSDRLEVMKADSQGTSGKAYTLTDKKTGEIVTALPDGVVSTLIGNDGPYLRFQNSELAERIRQAAQGLLGCKNDKAEENALSAISHVTEVTKKSGMGRANN